MKDMKMNILIGFMILTGVFTVLLVWLWLLDLAYSDENNKLILVAAIGLIGTILSGAISGGLTLLGVKLTIDNQMKKEEERRAVAAKYLFTEMLPYLTYLNETIKSGNTYTVINNLESLKSEALKLIEVTKENYSGAIQINIDFYRNMKSIEYHANELVEYIRFELGGKSDQQIIGDLMVIRNNLAKCNSKFDTLIINI